MVQSYIIHIIISILVVLIFHNLYQYIQENYTTKKTKDVYGYQQQKYSEILDKIETLYNQELLHKDNSNIITDKLLDNSDEDYTFAADDLLKYVKTNI
jgi:hypothetical protein